MRSRFPSNAKNRRSGTTLVEMAFVLPVFFLFLFTLLEFAHAYFVMNTLGAATRKAARAGSCDGVTTAQVEQQVRDTLQAAMRITNVSVIVKDGSLFDGSSPNAGTINYANLPAIELNNAKPRQLFIVRAEVSYADVALVPPMWLTGLTLNGQSVMRHE